MSAQDLNEQFLADGLLLLGFTDDGEPIAMPWPPEDDDVGD